MEEIAERLQEKIQTLTCAQLAEVERFVESMQDWEQSRALSRTAARMSERSLSGIWNNPEDDVYDAL